MNNLLGTNAPIMANVSLVVSIVVVVLLTIGVVLARRRRYTAHGWVQTSAVVLNIVLVLLVMAGSYVKAVAPGVPARLGEAYYGVAVLHGLLGLAAALFGIFVVLRANNLVPKALQFSNYKAFMRAAYSLYLVATLAGAGLYTTWYRADAAATTQTALASNTSPDTITIAMANFEFAPREIVVPQGATITWVNQDGAPHNVVGDDGAFRSELLKKGEQFSTTFSTLGTFAYYCELHGAAGGVDMAAVLKVVAAQDAPTLASAPATTVQPTAADQLASAPQLPTQARTFIAQLLDDGPGLPARGGYIIGLQTQADELVRHAALVARAQQANDPSLLRRHAEHVYNLIAGSLDPRFGDLDGDSHAQNPGDGFGMLPNGAQAGYIQASAEAAKNAGNAADATDPIKLHASHVEISAENIRIWVTEGRDIALRLTESKDTTATAADVARLVQISLQVARGVDTNGDSEIAPVTGEGGALVAVQHAHYMAGLGFSPTATP